MKTLLNTSTVKTLQVLNWLFFGLMILANYLANALPLNDKTTGELSAQYPNLFVPAPMTFSIWAVIYGLLFVFCIKQSTSLFSKQSDTATAETVSVIGGRFIIVCVLNVLWLLAWHYEYIVFSVLVMLAMLVQLINLNTRLNTVTPYLSAGSRFALKAPMGTYLGWICIATIANITAVLVANAWDGWGQSESFWAVTMIIVGACISSWALIKLKNAYIGLAVIWAFIGVITARIEAETYYRFIVWSAVFGMLAVGAATAIEATGSLFRSRKERIITVTDSKHVTTVHHI